MSEILYKYVGNGGWLTHVPKRDLTATDILDFNINEEVLEKSGLYKKVKKEVKIQSNFPKKGKEE